MNLLPEVERFVATEALSSVLDIPIIRIVRQGAHPDATYVMHLADGSQVLFRSSGQMLNQRHLRQAVFNSTGRVIRSFNPKQWRKLSEGLMKAVCAEEEAVEDDPLLLWLAFLIMAGVSFLPGDDDRTIYLTNQQTYLLIQPATTGLGDPVINERARRLSIERDCWVNVLYGGPGTARALNQRYTLVGFNRGDRPCSSAWVVEAEEEGALPNRTVVPGLPIGTVVHASIGLCTVHKRLVFSSWSCYSADPGECQLLDNHFCTPTTSEDPGCTTTYTADADAVMVAARGWRDLKSCAGLSVATPKAGGQTAQTQHRRTGMIELYKDGDQMAIRTDAQSEIEFTDQFAELLSDLIEAGTYDCDWEFQLRFWLQQYVEICCALRGYKADVDTRTVYVAGSRMMTQAPTHAFHRNGERIDGRS